MSSPLHERKAPLLKSFWRRFWWQYRSSKTRPDRNVWNQRPQIRKNQ